MRTVRILLLLAVVALALGLALTSRAPQTEVAAPTAADVATAKAVFDPVRNRIDSRPIDLTLHRDDISAGATLAANAVAPLRIAATYAHASALVLADYPLPLGRWFNARATLTQGTGVIPVTRLQLGHLPIPAPIATPLVRLALKFIGWRYPTLPQPEKVVERVQFGPDALLVRLRLPPGTKIYEHVADALGTAADKAAVGRIYCTLAELQRRDPSDDFAIHVRRAFAASGGEVVTANRIALAALPLFLGEPRSLQLFGGLSPTMERCGGKGASAIKLGAREDLPHHWAVSAALAEGLGTTPTAAIGGWKELSDSLPGGSGYSFVDLAADRSGFRFGRAATDPATADAVRRHIATISADGLLPPTMLTLTESLSAEDFKRSFGGEGSPRYRAMLARIDAALDAAGVPR